MSTSMPRNPPNGGRAPAPVAKKTTLPVWILVGVFGISLLLIVAVAGLGFYAAHKIREAGDNPRPAVARLMTSMNPDVEVLSTDDAKGIITVQDKKTGKTLTSTFRTSRTARSPLVRSRPKRPVRPAAFHF